MTSFNPPPHTPPSDTHHRHGDIDTEESYSPKRTPDARAEYTADPLSPLSPISPWPPLPVPSPVPSPSPSHTSAQSRSHSSSNDQLPNATDVYSSIAILLTYAAFGLYLIWAFSPESASWVEWLPDRQWALIVPCWMMVLVLATYLSYGALVIYRTPPFDSIGCITDPYANIPPHASTTKMHESGEIVRSGQPYYWKFADEDAINEPVDLPIDLVGRVLYPPRQVYKAHSVLSARRPQTSSHAQAIQ